MAARDVKAALLVRAFDARDLAAMEIARVALVALDAPLIRKDSRGRVVSETIIRLDTRATGGVTPLDPRLGRER